MAFKLADLKPDERATLALRGLYEARGYKKYKMARFEEYGLYAANQDFLGGEKVLTFTDLDGRLMALKPDVTLGIIKNTKASREKSEKLFYIENVYRESKESHTFKEINQLGLEYLGQVGTAGIAEVVSLAAESLREISPDYVLEISHMSFALELLRDARATEQAQAKLLKHIRNKNADGIRKTAALAGISTEKQDALCRLTDLYGEPEKTIAEARKLVINPEMGQALDQLVEVFGLIKSGGKAKNLRVDFSILNDIDYYNGVIFKGYIKKLGRSILSGGQYDQAMKIFGKDAEAMGFALYLNEISMLSGKPAKKEYEAVLDRGEDMLNIALPKGRLGDKVYEMLAQAGYDCPAFYEQNRKLVIENKKKKVRYLLVKPSDVAIYVEHHAADVGIVGKDILLETAPDVYELMDLNIGKCRMAVAAPAGYVEDTDRTLRVATKYMNVAKEFYAAKNRDIDLIKLNGSIELGPILGLSDVIVDIVETGNTLRENNLEVIEEFRQISARVIANKSSFKFQNRMIRDMVKKLEEAVK